MPSGALGVVSPAVYGGEGAPAAGAGRRKVTAKALRRMLKKAGLKTTGKKAALTRRAKKAHLKMGGAFGMENATSAADEALAKEPEFEEGGRRSRRARRRSRKNGLVQGVYRGTTGVAKRTLGKLGTVGRTIFGRGGNEQELKA